MDGLTDGNKIVTGLIAGALIGTIAGLLLAPKPGREARDLVAYRAGELRQKAGDYMGILRQRIRKSEDADGLEESINDHVISAN